jgi:hypothetical protein
VRCLYRRWPSTLGSTYKALPDTTGSPGCAARRRAHARQPSPPRPSPRPRSPVTQSTVHHHHPHHPHALSRSIPFRTSSALEPVPSAPNSRHPPVYRVERKINTLLSATHPCANPAPRAVERSVSSPPLIPSPSLPPCQPTSPMHSHRCHGCATGGHNKNPI